MANFIIKTDNKIITDQVKCLHIATNGIISVLLIDGRTKALQQVGKELADAVLALKLADLKPLY